MTVGHDHAAVKSRFSGATCRNHFQFCRKEILLFYVIGLLQKSQHFLLHGFLLFALQRLAADDDVQIIPFNDLARLLLQLFSGKMDEQIRDEHHRILVIFADDHINGCSILFDHHTMYGQRNGDPLILLDSTIVVRIQICKVRILVERILLHIKPW